MRIVLNILFGTLLLVWLPGIIIAFGHECYRFFPNFKYYLWLWIGIAAYLPVHFIIVSRFEIIRVFEHELTHAIFSLLFLRRVTRFKVTGSNGGLVTYRGRFGGRFGDIAISLSPYMFPTFTLLLVIARPFFIEGHLPFVDAAIGFTFGFHTLTTIAEIRLAYKNRVFVRADGEETKSDIARAGVIFSAIYIVFFTLLFHGIILSQITGGFRATGRFFKAGFVDGFGYAVMLFNWCRAQIAAML